LKVSSILSPIGRVFLGDLVKYSINSIERKGICSALFIEGNVTKIQVQKSNNFKSLSDELKAKALSLCQSSLRKEDYFLRWIGELFADTINIQNETIISSRFTNSVYFRGHLKYINTSYEFFLLNQNDLDYFYYLHSAKKLARENNTSVVLALLNLFSDETSGNESNRFVKYKNPSFTIANHAFNINKNNENSYLL
jgi:hypothetical protein